MNFTLPQIDKPRTSLLYSISVESVVSDTGVVPKL
jgi:hypothetical protein